MNIFYQELKANFRSLLIWGGVVVLVITEAFVEFSAIAENPDIMGILDEVPSSILDAFSLNEFNMSTVTGFFGVIYIYYALFLTLSAVMWGSDIISKEERDKTVEFSLTLPITRGKLITAKTLAALVNCIALNLITWGVTLSYADKYHPDSEYYEFLSLGMLSLFILQVIFLAAGVFLGAAMRQHKRASSVAVALLLGTYFLSIITLMNEDLEFLKYLSPFRYFAPIELLRESTLDMNYVWLSLGVIVVAMVGAFVSYAKRDLYI